MPNVCPRCCGRKANKMIFPFAEISFGKRSFAVQIFFPEQPARKKRVVFRVSRHGFNFARIGNFKCRTVDKIGGSLFAECFRQRICVVNIKRENRTRTIKIARFNPFKAFFIGKLKRLIIISHQSSKQINLPPFSTNFFKFSMPCSLIPPVNSFG